MSIREAAEGDVIDGGFYRMSRERVLAFSGGPLGAPNRPRRNLHTDDEKAHEAGLTAPIASGLQTQGHLIRLMIDLFGDAWMCHGDLHLKFFGPVSVGDTVQPRVCLSSRSEAGDGIVFVFDAWCERGDGERVMAGTACCLLPAE